MKGFKMETTINNSTNPNKARSYEALRENLNEAKKLIEEDINQLEKLAGILARKGHRLTRISWGIKVIVIFLGALSATSGTNLLSEITSETQQIIADIFYPILGLSIATISGLDAAFKYEARSSGRRLLAGTVSAKVIEFKSDLNRLLRECTLLRDKGEISEAEFIKFQDEINRPVDEIVMFISDVFQKASELGVNLKYDLIVSQEEK
jgi:hypothetical protein